MAVLVTLCLMLTFLESGTAYSIFGYDNPDNLVINSGFEEPLVPGRGWGVHNAKVEVVTDNVHRGSQALRIVDRMDPKGGVTQQIDDVKNNTMYYASLYIQTPNDSAITMFLRARIMVQFNKIDGTSDKKSYGELNRLRSSEKFRQFGADFLTHGDMESLELSIAVDDLTVDYVIDSFSLVEIPEDPDWKEKADAAIREHRMDDVSITADIPQRVPYCKVDFKVTQTSYDFRWTATVRTDPINENSTFGENYRNFIATNFNGAVLTNGMKWLQMEFERGDIRYERVAEALDFFESKGIQARGHYILSNAQKLQPTWVRNMTGEELRAEAIYRINYTLTLFNGRILEWDVLNEWLRGQQPYFEPAIGDPYFHDQVWNMSRELDPSAKYFLNDYSVLRQGLKTSGYVHLVEELAERGIHVDGMGIQTHIKDPISPVEIYKRRLDILATAGVNITITEASFHAGDEVDRMKMVDALIRLAYAEPAVKNIALWSFSNVTSIKDWDDNYLFVGEEFTPTLAGQCYLDLRKNWTTNEFLTASDFGVMENVRVFHGGYNIETLYDGQSVGNQSYYIAAGDGASAWMVDLDDADFPDDIPPEDFEDCGLTPPGNEQHLLKSVLRNLKPVPNNVIKPAQDKLKL